MKMMIERCISRYREIQNKEFYYIVTVAELEYFAVDETIIGSQECLCCLPAATEKAII